MRSLRPFHQFVNAAATLLMSALIVASATETRADPIGFQFGVPAAMTLVQNQPVPIPAAIINTGTVALEFDALSFGGGYAPSGPPVLPSAFDPGPEGNDGQSFYAQFSGLRLESGDRFDFIFGRLNVLGTPIGTVLRPRFSFQLNFPSGRVFAENSPVVTVGSVISYAPLAFVDNEPAPVPEPGTWVLVGTGMGYLLRRRARCRLSGAIGTGDASGAVSCD